MLVIQEVHGLFLGKLRSTWIKIPCSDHSKCPLWGSPIDFEPGRYVREG